MGKREEILAKCKDYYKISVEAYEDTHIEGQEIIDFYHNRHYTQKQLAKLKEQGQPAETFNVIKMFANAIIGYLETVVTTVTAVPRYPSSSILANITNDVIQYTLDENDWHSSNIKVKLDGLLTGLMCVYEEVIDTGVKDTFGRPIYTIKLHHIPSYEVRIDPQSKLDDYSDARFIHHFKWVNEEDIRKAFGNKIADELTAYYNYLISDPLAEWDYVNKFREIGEYKQYDNYLIVKSIIEYKGKIYSVIWSNDYILELEEVTFKEVRFPYRVLKLSNSNITEYYGVFRDIIETQKAINQALLKIQLLVNTSRVFVEDGSVDDVSEFKNLFERVNSVIPVLNLAGIKIENLNPDIVNQYQIIDSALKRIKMVLGINDSFLGQAYASDSGKKVQIQKMASASQLTNIVNRITTLFKLMGEDIFKLIRQFYHSHQILRVSAPLNRYHFIELNKPIEYPIGPNPQTGEPITVPILQPEIDPKTGDVMRDDSGNIIVVPLTDPDTNLTYADVDIKIIATRTDKTEEINQQLLESFSNSPVGQVLLQMNPVAYLQANAMMLAELGTKHSIELAKLLIDTATKVSQGQIDPTLAMYGGDLQKILGKAYGGSTGNPQNTQGGQGAKGFNQQIGSLIGGGK